MSGDVRLLLNGEWEFAEGGRSADRRLGARCVTHRSREFEDEPPESGWYRTELPDGWNADGRICSIWGGFALWARLSRW